MPLLEGLDGVEKMSKSLGNYIGLTDDPSDAYGKLMSISDTLMWRYYSLLLSFSDERIEEMKLQVVQEKIHPMALKKEMAFGIIEQFWSLPQAKLAQETFVNLFQKKDLSSGKQVKLSVMNTSVWIVDVLKELQAVPTSSEAKRLIESGAVMVDGRLITEFKEVIVCISGMSIKVGKHRIYTLV